jgi:hypothetical protein
MKNLHSQLARLVVLATLTPGCSDDPESAAPPASNPPASKSPESAPTKPAKVSLPTRLQGTVVKVDATVEGRGDAKPVAFTVELPKEWKADALGSKTRLKWVNGGADRDYLGRVDISWSAKEHANLGAGVAVTRPGEVQSVAREEVVDGINLKTHVGKAKSSVIRMRARTVVDIDDQAVLICEAGIVRDEGLGDAKAAQDLVEGICLKLKLVKN